VARFRCSSIFLTGLSVIVAVASAACAQSPDDHPVAPSTTASATPPGASPPATAPPVPPASKVTVTTTAHSYQVGAVVTASIANGLDRPIYTDDFKTACGIAYLQRSSGGTWTDITGCRLGRPTMTVKIGAGLSREVQFDPYSFHLTAGKAGPGFGAGTYRVKFTCRFDADMGVDDPMVAYSTEFQVG
jgi:hypothetical protein